MLRLWNSDELLASLAVRLRSALCIQLSGAHSELCLTGSKPKGTKVETFRIDYLIRTPKVEKLSLQPISCDP